MTSIFCNMQQLVAGRYKLRAIRPDGTVRELTGWFDNLITDVGMDQIAIYGNGSFGIAELFTKCRVGTGNTPPAFTDTDLVSPLPTYISNESYTNTFVEGTPAYWSCIRTYRFGTGVAAGNLTEVAVYDSVTNQAFSRALITDGGGTPITVTVLSDEILDVTYEYRSYIDKTMYTDSVLISGVGYSMQRMPYGIGTAPAINHAIRNDGAGNLTAVAHDTNSLGTVYQDLAVGGGSGGSGGATFATYINGSFYKDVTYVFDLTMANFAGGIGSILLDMRQTKMKLGFTPKIPKDNTKTLSVTFRVSWARYP